MSVFSPSPIPLSATDPPDPLRNLGAASELRPATRSEIRRLGYTLGQEPIARGATAVVFEAVEDRTQRKVALKVILRPSDAKVMKLFDRECRVLASENLPHGAAPYYISSYRWDGSDAATFPIVDDTAAQPFIAMERVHGVSVLEYAKSARSKPVAERLALTVSLFQALGKLHNVGLTHGDPSGKNVIIDPDGRVRFVDFGGSKRIDAIYHSVNSVQGPTGTPGFAPEVQLNGEERSAIWTDLRAASAVAFRIWTGKAQNDDNEQGWTEELRNAGAPRYAARIIAKGLRLKKQPAANNLKFYARAENVLDDFERYERKLRKRKTLRVIAITFLVFGIPALLLAWNGWRMHLDAVNSGRLQVLHDLRIDAARLTNASHPAVSAGLERAKDQDRKVEPDREPQAIEATIVAYREAIAASQGVERCQPLLKSIGQTLSLTPWVKGSPAMDRAKTELERRHQNVDERLKQGRTEDAWSELNGLLADVASQANQNAEAVQSGVARGDYERLETNVAPRLRQQERFSAIQQIAEDGRNAWRDGDWGLARRMFGQANQQLEQWLKTAETSEETARRRQNDVESLTRVLQEKTRLGGEIAKLSGERDGLTRRIQDLEGQIARQTAENLKDREARRLAEAGAASERSLRTDTAATIKKHERQLQAKADVETKLIAAQKAFNEADSKLKTALADVAKWRTTAETAQRQAEAWRIAAEKGGASAAAETQKMLAVGQAIDQAALSDWSKVNDALINTIAAYRRIESERTQALKDFTETSPTIQLLDARLKQHYSLVAKAKARLDEADKQLFDEIEAKAELLEKEHHDLTVRQGMRSSAAKVQNVQRELASLRNQQAPCKPGRDRTLGQGVAVDLARLIQEAPVVKQGPQAGDLLTLDVNGVPLKLRWCPPGTYKMGEAKVETTLSKGFWFMETEVTQGLWLAVMGANAKKDWGHGAGADYPVYDVSHTEAVEFGRKLTEAIAARRPSNVGQWKFTLPTEAQWEYAARADSVSEYCYGDDPAQLGGYATFGDNSNGGNQPVGRKKPNKWGIRDCHGSVWEWCGDWWADTLSGDVDPVGPQNGSFRVNRGGGWYVTAEYCGFSYRRRSGPSIRYDYLGFRLLSVP